MIDIREEQVTFGVAIEDEDIEREVKLYRIGKEDGIYDMLASVPYKGKIEERRMYCLDRHDNETGRYEVQLTDGPGLVPLEQYYVYMKENEDTLTGYDYEVDNSDVPRFEGLYAEFKGTHPEIDDFGHEMNAVSFAVAQTYCPGSQYVRNLFVERFQGIYIFNGNKTNPDRFDVKVYPAENRHFGASSFYVVATT